MRYGKIAIPAAVVIGLLAAAPVRAQEVVKPDPALDALIAKVLPHRAIYSLKAKTVATAGNVSDADGAISYELREECDRWLTKHSFVLHIVRHDARERTVRTDYSSWETKDGLTFGFETKTSTDGKESEHRTGRATLQRVGGPGKAVIEGKGPRLEIDLPAGTDFPSRHILRLIADAKAGEKIVWRRMFDGSSEGKISGVHAVLAEAVAAQPIQPASLFGHPGIRMKLAFFDPPGEGKERPNYKVDMTVNEASVTTAMVLDYSDFSLEAKIEKIETLPRAVCR